MSQSILSIYKKSGNVLNPIKYPVTKPTSRLVKEVTGATSPPHTTLSSIKPPQNYTFYINSLRPNV
jgi:hypothetical protein